MLFLGKVKVSQPNLTKSHDDRRSSSRPFLHHYAGHDLEALYNQDPDAAKRIALFIREATNSQELLYTFTEHGHGRDETDRYHVSRWERQQHKGRNLWRVKVWRPANVRHLRMVYAFVPPLAYYILGITTHDGTETTDFYDDDSHPFTQRVTAVYERLKSSR